MSEPRVIKKYPNRRLYDTVESRYITLADVQRLVLEKADFVVIDKKNNADITRSILLQVIAEQEQHGEPVLTQEFLTQVIRSHGGQDQDVVSGYLEQSLKTLMSNPHRVRERVGATPSIGAVSVPSSRLREVGRDLARELYREPEKDRLDPK
jgi:polyhydroxyalkanoate synthesis repressor PhaR